MKNQQEKIGLLNPQKHELKKQAHHLKPVVEVGKKGLSPALIQEIKNALLAHELIKIHIAPSLPNWDEIFTTIVRETKSQHIDTIGNIVILFLQRKENSRFLEEE